MAYTTINKSTDYFNTKLYTGNGSTQTISSVGFQPDWVWTKQRSGTEHHNLNDAVRGATKVIFPNLTNAEQTVSNLITGFVSDGFSVADNAGANNNGSTYVSWNWKANGQGSSNTDGTINSTYTSANTTSGFSIVTYTGTGSAGTVGHGLGTTPSMVWIFNRTDGGNGHVFHKALGSTQYLLHASTLGVQTYAPVGIGSLTSSTFSVGTVGGVNGSGKNYVAYVFSERKGFSSINSYTGNGNADGTFVYTGFAPKFVLLKITSGSDGWWLVDDKQANPYPNPNVQMLVANTNAGDNTSVSPFIDIYSNGFKLKSTWSGVNGSGSTYIYMSFGQSIVGSNNIPCTAR